MLQHTFAGLLALSLSGGCGAGGDVDIAFHASGHGLEREGADRAGPGGAVAVTGAEMMIRDVSLEDFDGQIDHERFVWEPVDLLDPSSSQLNLLDVEPGKYRRVRFRIRAQDGYQAGTTGRKVSMYVTGTIDDVPFEYRDDTPDEIDLESDLGVLVEDGHLADLVVQFDVDDWFAGLDLSGLAVSPDGIIYIDGKHNRRAQTAIRKAITASISLAG